MHGPSASSGEKWMWWMCCLRVTYIMCGSPKQPESGDWILQNRMVSWPVGEMAFLECRMHIITHYLALRCYRGWMITRIRVFIVRLVLHHIWKWHICISVTEMNRYCNSFHTASAVWKKKNPWYCTLNLFINTIFRNKGFYEGTR